ncbi:MAG TPA: NAD(+)/NADH kinase [Candidatus Hydrothermia bacterium]|nr:NAD(+)/NADH kinase [Candidatus Hydrothermia bacterium]MDD5572391.1 NAD(+)/NADH kinase [Candidatus Hydrothermia bacterium]HOK23292.1 NAD(+)/NADH kinase [Candidatus Hydrothermia bacterium]HOL24101.1 NAD(+)/NADH kinase [Candidatus Hydrothermia bacterium]HPO79001.1 NAD(+)/NADH kinase [Candidatus Hydrothermia bacterium]
MIFGITGNPVKEGIERILSIILDTLEPSDILIWDGLKDKILSPERVQFESENAIKNEADVIITIGGDGTFLRTARVFNSKPIIGVNVGTFGFLTIYGQENIRQALEDLVSGRWSLEERVTVKATVEGRTVIALNDITINVTGSSRMLSLNVKVDGQNLFDFRGDGLLISTPTGSTAYNLSAGGPILYPTMEALVITPICPHKLSLRPVVVPARSRIEAFVSSRTEDMILSADGQEIIPLKSGNHIFFTRDDSNVKMVKTPGVQDYFEILKNKLSWG